MRVLLMLVAMALGAAAARGQDVPVEYTVLLREPQTQYVEIAVRFKSLTAQTLEVSLPVWRPGKYAVIDPVATVTGLGARSGLGKPLECIKIDKASWIIQTAATHDGADNEAVVQYRVYCNSLSDRTRHVDDTHAFLSPASVFLYAPEFRQQPAHVRVIAPEGWKTATGLSPDPADASLLLAPSYDVLIDSPLEIGFHDTIAFEVDGLPHEIVTWSGRKDVPAGLGPEYDKAKLVDRFSKIIRAEKDVFGEYPYSRYVFLVHCASGSGAGGGTEHLNSTIMQTGPSAFADEAGLKRFMGLVAHEYFHTWNVKQLRPAGLKPLSGLYDLQQENYTDLLWVAEGTTDYMDMVCRVRAGLTKPDDALKTLAGWVTAARTRPGVGVQSAAESSFDAWVKFNKSWADSANTTVSFYDKGCWVSLCLDMELRRRSGNAASLDTVLRELYRMFPLAGPGYTEEDLIKTAERLTTSSFRDWFADFVRGTKPLEFEAVLAVAGLELVLEPAKAGGDDEPKEAGAREAGPASKAPVKERAYIGLNLGADGVVSGILSDGPAYAAGLIAGDSVVAVDGQRVRSAADLEAHLKRAKPGDSVKVVFFRFDRLREVEFKAAGRADGTWTVHRAKEATPAQRQVYSSWLGQEWPGEKKADPAEGANGKKGGG